MKWTTVNQSFFNIVSLGIKHLVLTQQNRHGNCQHCIWVLKTMNCIFGIQLFYSVFQPNAFTISASPKSMSSLLVVLHLYVLTHFSLSKRWTITRAQKVEWSAVTALSSSPSLGLSEMNSGHSWELLKQTDLLVMPKSFITHVSGFLGDHLAGSFDFSLWSFTFSLSSIPHSTYPAIFLCPLISIVHGCLFTLTFFGLISLESAAVDGF